MCDFIEKEYLEEQVTAIKKLADMVTQLNRVGEGILNFGTPLVRVYLIFILGLGVYLWDQQLHDDGTGAGSRARA